MLGAFQNTMRGVLDQDRDDDLLSLVVHPTHTLTDGLVPKPTHWPIQDLSKLYVFPSPVRKTNRGVYFPHSRGPHSGTLACKVPGTSADLGETKGKVPAFWSPLYLPSLSIV